MGSLTAEKIDSLKAIELSELQKTLAPSLWESQTARPRIRPRPGTADCVKRDPVRHREIAYRYSTGARPRADGLAQTFRQSTNRTCEMIA
jgi:hypothetical protein